MTTAETADADELRRETLADAERTKREQEERDHRDPEA